MSKEQLTNSMDLMNIIEILCGLVLTAYGFIFGSIVRRLNKLETKQEEMNPVLLTIQTTLAAIKKDLEWLKELK